MDNKGRNRIRQEANRKAKQAKRNAEIIDLYKKGWDQGQLARRFEISPSGLSRMLKREGVTTGIVEDTKRLRNKGESNFNNS